MNANVVTLKNVTSWLAPANTRGGMGRVGPALLASHFLRSGYGRGKFGTSLLGAVGEGTWTRELKN